MVIDGTGVWVDSRGTAGGTDDEHKLRGLRGIRHEHKAYGKGDPSIHRRSSPDTGDRPFALLAKKARSRYVGSAIHG